MNESRGRIMNEPVCKISNVLGTSPSQMYQNRPAQASQTDPELDNNKVSSKYIIENNLVVYEKYDRDGRLISRVPWSVKTLDKKG